jgi:hypothetical protein
MLSETEGQSFFLKAVMPACHPYAHARNVPLKRCLPEAVK